MKFDGPVLNGRWRLGPRMGAGAQARTYLARDERQRDRVVVVKQLQLSRSGGTWKNFDLFEREVRVLKSLVHPGIPRFIEHFESEPGVFNLVIERMPGATLRSFAKKVAFTDDELRDVLARMLEILDYLHGLDPPVVHRDIKPANIVRGADGKISLVDFGGVREVLHEQGGSTIVGTFGYMAPEQLHGQALPTTDIYGLGATLVALAGGVEPESVPRKGLRMDLATHLAGRDPVLREVLEAMTEPDPDRRPQTARDVAALLGRLSRARAQRAADVVAPAQADGDERALARPHDARLRRQPFDDIGDMLDHVPPPLQFALRMLLATFAIGGYLGVSLLRVAALPIVFALVGAIASDASRPKVSAVRRDVEDALDEGRDGFKNLLMRSRHAGLAPRTPLTSRREQRRLERAERRWLEEEDRRLSRERKRLSRAERKRLSRAERKGLRGDGE